MALRLPWARVLLGGWQQLSAVLRRRLYQAPKTQAVEFLGTHGLEVVFRANPLTLGRHWRVPVMTKAASGELSTVPLCGFSPQIFRDGWWIEAMQSTSGFGCSALLAQTSRAVVSGVWLPFQIAPLAF